MTVEAALEEPAKEKKAGGKQAIMDEIIANTVVDTNTTISDAAPIVQAAATEEPVEQPKEKKAAKADANMKVEAAAEEEPAAKSIKEAKTAKVTAAQDE